MAVVLFLLVKVALMQKTAKIIQVLVEAGQSEEFPVIQLQMHKEEVRQAVAAVADFLVTLTFQRLEAMEDLVLVAADLVLQMSLD